MRRRFSWLAAILAVCIGLMTVFPQRVHADAGAEPMHHIVASAHGALPIPLTYTVERVITLFTPDSMSLQNPADMFIDPHNNLFILDVNRIIKYSIDESGLTYVRTYHLQGDTAVSGASGIFVDSFGDIFIADTNNNRVLVVGAETGSFVEEFVQPDSPLYDTQYAFRPVQVAVDTLGQLFILNDEDDNGFIILDAHNRFMGYTAPFQVAPESFIDAIIRNFATEAQRQRIGRRTRPMHSNFVFAPDNTFFVTSARASENQLMRFTSVGINIFPLSGDLSFPELEAALIDVAVDAHGNISVLDNNSGFIVQYSAQGVMLTAFGGRGGWAGTFINPVALEIDSYGRMYVLDRTTGSIHVFRPTAFMDQVHGALALYSEGRYNEARDLWYQIHNVHSAYPAAVHGLARAYFRQDDFINAMAMYQRIYNVRGYSDAFEQWRLTVLRDNFGFIVLGGLALIVATIFGISKLRTYALKLSKGGNEHLDKGWHIAALVIFAPTDGFRRIKADRASFSYITPALILIGLLAVRVFNIMFTHFPHASVLPHHAVFAQEISAILAPALLWGVSVYLVTAILSGEAKFREMMAATMYALLPIVALTVPLTLFSHLLGVGNGGLYNWLFIIVFIWSGILLLISISVMNTYTYKETLLVAFLTVCAVVFMIVVSALVYTLGLRVMDFVRQVFTEYRILFFH